MMRKPTDSISEYPSTVARSPFSGLFQEWILQLLLVAAVVVALVDGVASLAGSSVV